MKNITLNNSYDLTPDIVNIDNNSVKEAIELLEVSSVKGVAPRTAGGGLTKSKLALADAVVGDVLSGKKFYAGDKIIKAGTMANRGAWSSSVAPGSSVAIPQGYHNGNGTVAASGIRHVTFYASGSTPTVYFSSKLPYSVYSKLTLNNIVVEPNNWYVRWGNDGEQGAHATALNKQYNPSNGVLTFTTQGKAGIWDLNYGADACTVHVFY